MATRGMDTQGARHLINETFPERHRGARRVDNEEVMVMRKEGEQPMYRITRAEWNKTPRDYKLVKREDGRRVRYRLMLVRGETILAPVQIAREDEPKRS